MLLFHVGDGWVQLADGRVGESEQIGALGVQIVLRIEAGDRWRIRPAGVAEFLGDHRRGIDVQRTRSAELQHRMIVGVEPVDVAHEQIAFIFSEDLRAE